eukprot:Blabericola_migrator_1__466@NODE_1112_length_5403_cov_99_872939_g711_i1_p1_GENE_NODE_1112_length_5403_cov_99_872939_g711_i1NODE_1112_length_5403_cov_99_872939_g711_i1_p1_ORF_typecomplete_len842_score178_39DNA_ligase_A_M/PF01068_21/4e58DNA_ligase_A_N/PF04675_14/4_2e33DNA_ligase_A_N/PF04675_14/4_9e03DNA_ligase_A_C/PF04679_15/7_2e29RNA_ligase/PF09414_10/0_0016mRNA_cap_enzyme/PF01331_19/0_008_NODE_1112_length_5403_cov_99_872939_g711_i1152540
METSSRKRTASTTRDGDAKKARTVSTENDSNLNHPHQKQDAKRHFVQTTLFGKTLPVSPGSKSPTSASPKTTSDSPFHLKDEEPKLEGEAETKTPETKLEEETAAVKLEAETDAAAKGSAHDLTAPETLTEVLTGGSSNEQDDAFNPALVPIDQWAYYTLKGTTKQYQEDTFLFATLANTWQLLEDIKHGGVGSKKKAILILTNYYRLLLYHCPHELVPAVFLCLHRVAPDYFGVEIGIGESLLIKTICETYSRKEAFVKAELEEKGDLGEVAQTSRSTMSLLFVPNRLTIRGVFQEMRAIAETKGNNAQTRKRDKIKKLLVSAVKTEPKFIVRFLEKNLRTGVKSMSVLSALAFAFVLSPPAKTEVSAELKRGLLKCEIDNAFVDHCSKIKVCADVRQRRPRKSPSTLEAEMEDMEQAVRQAYSQVPNIAYVVYHLLCGLTPDELRSQCVICPGVPVSPMLAKPTKGLGEVLDAMEGNSFIAEYKYDGERVQIHKLDDGTVHLFSRNLETLDEKYPDVKATVISAVQGDTVDFILDSEVVAWDKETQTILPFQVLSSRKRKDVEISNISVEVCLYVFDCLRHNGEVLVATSLENRKARMLQAVKEIPGKLTFAKGAAVADTVELEALLSEAIDSKTEGLMVKIKDGERSYYEPSKRSVNWLKLKKDYLDTLGDSVDLVPIGAFWGRGRRSGAYGAYLLAVYDSEDEVYRTVCKVATGFTDEDLTKHYDFFKERQLTTKPPYYHVSKRMTPDVWLEACQVWECKAADLSVSPVHTAAWERKGSEKGIGLRFPRYLKIRDDKRAEDATDSMMILDMYEAQYKAKKAAGKEVDEDAEEDDLLI